MTYMTDSDVQMFKLWQREQKGRYVAVMIAEMTVTELSDDGKVAHITSKGSFQDYEMHGKFEVGTTFSGYLCWEFIDRPKWVPPLDKDDVA